MGHLACTNANTKTNTNTNINTTRNINILDHKVFSAKTPLVGHLARTHRCSKSKLSWQENPLKGESGHQLMKLELCKVSVILAACHGHGNPGRQTDFGYSHTNIECIEMMVLLL